MENEFTDRKGNKVIKPADKEVLNRLSAYGMAQSGNKILLVNPTWKKDFELPGGAIENETVSDGLKREFLEETGYHIEMLEETPIETRTSLFYADDIDTFFDSKMLFFEVRIIGEQEQNLIDKKEIREIKWVDLEKLGKNKMKVNKMHQDIIRKVS